MRFEREVVCREFVPDGIELVHFTRISFHQMLKDASGRDRNIRICDGAVFVFHIQNVKMAANSERMLCVVKLGTPRNSGSAPVRKSARVR